jgi:hypothetical protein
MQEENEQISSEPTDASFKLSEENENLVVEFGKHSKKLEEILTEDFCDVLRRNYGDKATLEKCAGDYYKGLLARGFFTDEQFETVMGAGPLYKKQNLSSEEEKERKKYNEKRSPLVRKLRTHFNTFLDIVFRPRNAVAASFKTPAKEEDKARKRVKKPTPNGTTTPDQQKEETPVPAVLESKSEPVMEPVQKMADLAISDVQSQPVQQTKEEQERINKEQDELQRELFGDDTEPEDEGELRRSERLKERDNEAKEKGPEPESKIEAEAEAEAEVELEGKTEPDEDYEEIVQKDNEETKEMREQGRQKYALFEPAEHCFLGLGVEVEFVKLIIDPFCGKSKSVASYFEKKKPGITVASYDKYYNKYFDFFDEAEWSDLYDALIEDHDITTEEEGREVCLVCCPPRNAIAAFFDRVLQLECSFLVLIPTSFLIKNQMKMLMAGKSGMLYLCGAIKLFDVRKNKHVEEDMCWIWHAEHLHNVKRAAIYMTLDPALDYRIIEKCRLEQEEDKKKKALDDAKV